QGGTSAMRADNSIAASSAVILVPGTKTIKTTGTGSVIIRGGFVDAATAPRAQRSQALASLDPSKLTMNVAGAVILEGGLSTNPALLPANSARIDAGGEIDITVGSTIRYVYNNSGAGPIALNGSFLMIGGGG